MTASLYKEPEAGKLYWIRRYPKPFPDGSIFQISNLEMKRIELRPTQNPIFCYEQPENRFNTTLFLTSEGERFAWTGFVVVSKINLSAYVKNWRCDWRESGGERFYLEEVENDDE